VDGDARPDSVVREWIEDANADYLVAEDDRIVGFISIRKGSHPRYPMFREHSFAMIEDAVVEQSVRGQGVGTQLFNAAIMWARERGLGFVQTRVWSANARTREFYLRQGFRSMTEVLELDLDAREAVSACGRRPEERAREQKPPAGKVAGAAKKSLSPKYQPWVEARKRLHLSHAHIQMARELGLNPKKLRGKANHKQEPWKAPLPIYIEELYWKRFRKEPPADALPLEKLVAERKRKKAERKAARKAVVAPEPVGDDDLPF
jgi:GNAT superfamily N-acetyltransferase